MTVCLSGLRDPHDTASPPELYKTQTISQKYTSVFIYSPSTPESIESFIEGQAFPRSNDLGPPPPLTSPPSTVRKLDRRYTGMLSKRDNLLTEEGGGGGGGAESYDRKKPGPL